MPSVLTVALPSTSAGAGARRYAAGARFVPTPNPAAASAKTRARSARPTPSSVSRGRSSTLNAYRLPMGRLNTVAASTMRHARRAPSASLILLSLGWGDARSGDGARSPERVEGERMTMTLNGEGQWVVHRRAVHLPGESPFMSRRSCQRESDGSNPTPSAAPGDGGDQPRRACARYTTAPASGTIPAATSAPPKPHVPAARPRPHGPRSWARSAPSPIVLIAAPRPVAGTASPARLGRITKATP